VKINFYRRMQIMYESSNGIELRLPDSFGGSCTGNTGNVDRQQQQEIQGLRNQLSILLKTSMGDRAGIILYENQQLREKVYMYEEEIKQMQTTIEALEAQVSAVTSPALKKGKDGLVITNEQIRVLFESGLNASQIGKQLGMTRQAIRYRLNSMGL
jgi:hypothetical protein